MCKPVIAALALLVSICAAQESFTPTPKSNHACKWRLFLERTVWQYPSQTDLGRPEETSWWSETVHKHPEFCLTLSAADANYIVSWSSEVRDESRLSIPHTSAVPQNDANLSIGTPVQVQKVRVRIIEVSEGFAKAKPIYAATDSTDNAGRFDQLLQINSAFGRAWKALQKSVKVKK